MAADYVRELDEILKEVNPDKPTKPVWGGEDKPIDREFLKSIAGTADRTTFGIGGITASRQNWREANFDNSPVGDALASISGKQASNDKRTLTDDQVKQFIRTRLTCGDSPRKVSTMLNKMAEWLVYNKSMSNDYLDDMSGMLGLGYLEPNHFMSASCQKSLEEIKKAGGMIKAACVKRIGACGSCRMCKKASGDMDRCDLYKLPIAGNAAEMKRAIASKFKTTKKAKLASIHNGDQARVENPNLVRIEAKSTQAVGRIASMEREEFTPNRVASMIKAGESFVSVFATGQKIAGTGVATDAVKKYISGLKAAGTPVNIAQIDCKYLRGKLGSNNPIQGVAKCTSCTYRRTGMHCGLTGGTLLGFPGMEATGSKTAAKTKLATDGAAMMNEFGLTKEATQLQGEIDMKVSFQSLDVSVDSIPTVY